MTRAKFILGITVLIFALSTGCSSSKAPPAGISDDTLHEVQIGSTVFQPEEINIIPFVKDNRITFQTLNDFSSKTFKESIAVKVNVRNVTRGWTNILTTSDVFNNGTVFFENNEWGALVTYTTTHPLDRILRANSSGDLIEYYDEVEGDRNIYPGDRIDIEVAFIGAEYADNTPFLLFTDNFTSYCSSDVINRQVGEDNLDTEGYIESIKIGSFEISDEQINIIPLGEVNDITVDFNTQLNPYKFADLLKFRIVINNMTQDTSYTLNTNIMNQNGEINVVDYAEGIVRYAMDHQMTYFTNGGYDYTPANPGDMVQIWIDFIEGENSQLEEFQFQNKKFRIFFLASPMEPQTY